MFARLRKKRRMSPREQKVRLHPLQSMSLTSAGSRGAVPKQKLAEAAEKETKDALVVYMEATSGFFERDVAQTAQALFREVRGLRNYLVLSGELQEKHPQLVERASKIDDELWNLVGNTKRVGRRFQTQLRKVTDRISSLQARSASSLKPKSAGRKEAGKLKAESLRLWRQDFSAAREALKREGYKGSLKLKKGMPMYTKIEEMRQARVANQAQGALASEMPAFRRREDCLVGPGGS